MDTPTTPKVILEGFANLAADTFAPGPASGADNGSVDPIARIQPVSANGRTGPFADQPIQGFSAVQFAPGGDGNSYWFLSDNGFGSQSNSQDYLLRLYQVDPSFVGSETGDASVEIQGFVQLSDPNNLIPFDIINEGQAGRLLTGGDFDIESFVIADNGDIWVGEEFGPYLLHFNSQGVLLEAPIATPSFVDLQTLNGQAPLVIGHRGASGDFPEHTLEAYRAAIAAGADFIEPDLVITQDGVLIARHEPMLDDTTNVAELFGPERQSTKLLDGEAVTAYFAEDFTLAEIKQIRAVQSNGTRDAAFDGLFEIPTFQEVIELLQSVEAQTGVQVGIYPETKHPTFFDQQGMSLEEPLIEVLQDTGFTDPSRIFIQSFEIANLLDLKAQLTAEGLGDIPLVQLFGDTQGNFINAGGGGFSVPYDVVANQGLSPAEQAAIYGDLINFIDFENPSYADLTTPEAIAAISSYAAGLGPWKNNIFLRERIAAPVDGNGDGNAEITSQLTGEVFPLVDFAHAAGLQVHPYTLRDEERFLTLNPDGTVQTPQQEFEQFIEAGIDGFFTDFPRTGDPVRDKLAATEVRSPDSPDFNFNSLNGQTPLIIGHRGASGDFPEHTLEAYRLAIYQGADFVEPDLVITKDGVLIARHEPMLDDTTNVAELFGPERQSTKLLDGEEVTAYFAEDFTLAEIKQMRAVQPRPDRNQDFNGEFEIPTLAEVIELVNEASAAVGRNIGIYPETKHPTFFDQQGLSLEEPLVQTLLDSGFTNPNRIFIQSFEIANLLDLRNNLLPAAGLDNLKLVQLFGDTEGSFINAGGGGFSVPYDLVANRDLSAQEKTEIYGDLLPFLNFEAPGYDSLANGSAIVAISRYADGLGPWKNNILLRQGLAQPVDGNGDGKAEITSQLTGEVFPLIDFAHAAGLQVHPYTLRDEERSLVLDADGQPQSTGDEFRQLIELGVDGIFTDFPETGRIVLEQFETAEEFANLSGSRGYEGMAISPDRQTFYPMLEGTVFGDPAGSLRIYDFNPAQGVFEGIVGLYQMDAANHAIGDFTAVNANEYLVIERDGRQGADAAFKKIFKVDLSQVNADGFVEKELIADLLQIEDPNDLNGDGSTTFTFPFVTIEDVLVLDEDTILVANDNNYPFSVGRDLTGAAIDNNEIILLQLETPLDLAPEVGVAGFLGNGGGNGDGDNADSNGFRVNPYLQQPSSDGMYVTWFSESNSPGEVTVTGPGLHSPLRFSTTPTFEPLLSYTTAEQEQEINGLEQGSWLLGDENYKHSVDIRGLLPNQTYNYSVMVGDQEFESQFKTAPTAQDWDQIRFVVLSDSETEPRGRVLRRDWEQGAIAEASLPRPDVATSLWSEVLGSRGDSLNYPLTEAVGYQNNLAIINSRQPDFMMMPGDLVQGGGYQPGWDEFFRHNAGSLDSGLSQYPILPALGNWENFGALNGGYGTDADGRFGPRFGREKFHVYFDAPDNGTPEHRDNYYRVDYGPVTILTLDSSNGEPDDSRQNYGGEGQPAKLSGQAFTDPGTDTQDNFTREQYESEGGTDLADFNPGSIQWNWAIAQLEEASAQGQIVFAQFHHAPYSNGTHGLPMNHEDSSGQGGTPMRQYHSLFEQYGVTAVFSGHSEMFERSFVDTDGDGLGVYYYDVGIAGDGVRGQNRDAEGNLLNYNAFSQWTADQDEAEVWAEIDGIPQMVAGGKHYGHLEVNLERLDDGQAKISFTPVYSFPILDANYELVTTERRVYGDEIVFQVNTATAAIEPLELFGSSDNDSLRGGGGDDILYGNGGIDRLVGGAGDDMIYGGNQADHILGGSGNDKIYANGGADYIDSGSGLDEVWLGGASDAIVILSTGEGYDFIANYQMGSTTLKGFAESELTLKNGAQGAEIFKGDDKLAVVGWKTVSELSGAFVA